MKRKLFSIFLGLFAGFLTGMVCHLINSFFHQPPEGTDITKPEQRHLLLKLPDSFYKGSIISKALAVFVAAFVASLFRGRSWLAGALIPAGIFMLLEAAILSAMPHPVWYRYSILAALIPAGLFGYAVARWLLGNLDPVELNEEKTYGD